MNIYEEQNLEQKLEELTDHIGHLVLDIILISLKKVSREYQTFDDIADSRWSATSTKNTF
jgi:hypothetical protein